MDRFWCLPFVQKIGVADCAFMFHWRPIKIDLARFRLTLGASILTCNASLAR